MAGTEWRTRRGLERRPKRHNGEGKTKHERPHEETVGKDGRRDMEKKRVQGAAREDERDDHPVIL